MMSFLPSFLVSILCVVCVYVCSCFEEAVGGRKGHGLGMQGSSEKI